MEMKMSDLICPEMMELLYKFEKEMERIEFIDGQCYFYAEKIETLQKMVESVEFEELKDNWNIGNNYSFSVDRDLHYVIFS